MAHAGYVDYRPGTITLQRRRGRVPRSGIGMRALIAVCTLTHGTRALGEKMSGRFHVRGARHYRDRKAEQCTSCIRVDIRLTETERPRRRKIRHCVGACIGTDSDSHTFAETERHHSVHELSARGVAEQPVALPGRDALRKQQFEQPFDDAECPFFPRVGRALLIVQIAEMVL